KWTSDDERKAIRREFMSSEVVEVIVGSFPFAELGGWYEDAQKWICDQSEEALKAAATRIAGSLRGEKMSLSDEEEEVAQGVGEVLDDLAAFSGYAAKTGHDVYTFKYYMPLLVAHAVQDKKNITGLRSFSLVLRVVDTPESYSQARSSFAPLRR